MACTVSVVPNFRTVVSKTWVSLEDPAALLMRQQDDDLLGAIDPVGDVAFNWDQVDHLLERMERVAVEAADDEVAGNIREVVGFIRANMRPGLLVIFEGD